MATLSESMATWVSKSNYDSLPIDIVDIAKRNILDCVGTTLAGAKEPVARILTKYLKAIQGPEQATVIGMGVKSSCIEAAMANGILAHALDFDDLVIPATGAGGPHITAAILPAALSVAENQRKTGKDLILAYILGCEAAYRIGRSVDPTHYNSGWHTTGTEGIFGAAVAACKLLDMPKSNIAFAIGIAASEASGLRENFGTMTKFLHAGQAAAKGTRAALLAKYGYTSAKTIFEGETGFCNVFSKEPKKDEITKDLEEFVCMPQIRLKLYPCCAVSHAAIFATQQIMTEHRLDPVKIAKVTVFCDPQMHKILTFNSPKTANEGRFSVQFPLALAFFGKKVNLSELSDENIRVPDIITLMSKVQLIPNDELKARSVHSRAAVVEVILDNGERFEKRCNYPPGTPHNPIGKNDLIEKFRSCADSTLQKPAIEKLLQHILKLEETHDLDELVKIAGSHK